MSNISERLEQQADLLFNNVAGWEKNALWRIGRRVKDIKSLSYADLQAINNAAIVKQDVDAILKELATLTGQSSIEVKRIYAEMIDKQHEENKVLYDYRGKPFIPLADNKQLQAIVRAYARTTAETMVNLSMTKAKRLGFVDKNNNFVSLEKNFKEVLDKAVMSITTGTGDFNSEMRGVLRELGGSGLRVDYGGGVTRRLDTMVRQNLLWGAKQASVTYNEMIGEELGCDGIEIDWHSNPRPSHEFMQGKQYALGKARIVNGRLFESADNALNALNDYGCLHFKTPIICGVSEPRYSNEELAMLNAQNARKIQIDGVSKTGYEWKQTMRKLENEARKTKDQIELLKASGDNEGVRQLKSKLTAIEDKYKLVANGSGIKAQPQRMSVIKGKSDKNNIIIGSSPKYEQNFKDVERDEEDSVSVNRRGITISANRLVNTNNNLYLSSKITLKPKQQKLLDDNIGKVKNLLNASTEKRQPTIVVVDASEMNSGVIASYNPIDNIMRIDSRLGLEEEIYELQKSGVMPENELSTLLHELLHWKDAEVYRRKYGDITSKNFHLYQKWVTQRGKSHIDNLHEKGYNIFSISQYATDKMGVGNYDEAYTEYRTLIMLGG